jgi:transposase
MESNPSEDSNDRGPLIRGKSFSESFGRAVAQKFIDTSSMKETAEALECSRKFVSKVVKIARANNGIYKRVSKRKGRKRILTNADEEWINISLAHNPDLEIQEIVEDLVLLRHKIISPSTVLRSLIRLRITRKKLVSIAPERFSPLGLARRNLFFAELLQHARDDIFFVDETACDTLLSNRTHGYAQKGHRAFKAQKYSPGKRFSVLSCINSKHGLAAFRILEGTTNTAEFSDWMIERVLPLVPKGGAVVLDNAKIHQAPELSAYAQWLGIRLIFTSPYSPDLNPIELSYSFLKDQLKKHYIRDDKELLRAIHFILFNITPRHALAWMGRCGILFDE